MSLVLLLPSFHIFLTELDFYCFLPSHMYIIFFLDKLPTLTSISICYKDLKLSPYFLLQERSWFSFPIKSYDLWWNRMIFTCSSFSLFVVVGGIIYFPRNFQLFIWKGTFHYVIRTIDLMKPIDRTFVSITSNIESWRGRGYQWSGSSCWPMATYYNVH
jgi:hypothetical protein